MKTIRLLIILLTLVATNCAEAQVHSVFQDKHTNKWGAELGGYDKKKIIIEPKYDHLTEFSYVNDGYFSGRATYVTIATVNGKKGILREDDTFAVQPIYDDIEAPHPNLLKARFIKNGCMGILDIAGNIILPANGNFEDIKLSEEQPERVFLKNGGKWALGNLKTMQFLTKYEYDEISYDKEIGGIVIKRNGKKGILSVLGNEMLPAIYDEISKQVSIYRFVYKDGLFGLVTWDNKTLLPLEYKTYEDVIKAACKSDIEPAPMNTIATLFKNFINVKNDSVVDFNKELITDRALLVLTTANESFVPCCKFLDVIKEYAWRKPEIRCYNFDVFAEKTEETVKYMSALKKDINSSIPIPLIIYIKNGDYGLQYRIKEGNCSIADLNKFIEESDDVFFSEGLMMYY